MKVLLADDNRENQLIAQRFLTQRAIDLEIVSNGNEVIDRIKRMKFDLILMNLEMPIMNGMETSRIIRKWNSKQIRQVPIVALTSGSLEGVSQRIKGTGINEILIKPYQPEDLYSLISKYMKIPDEGLQDETEQSYLKGLYKYSDNDAEFALELIDFFMDNYREFNEMSIKAYQNKDLKHFREVCHKIKPSNRIFAIFSLDILINKIQIDLASYRTLINGSLIQKINMVIDNIIHKLTLVKQILNSQCYEKNISMRG